MRPHQSQLKVIPVRSKKPIRPSSRATSRPRRGAPVVDEASFTVVLEDLRAQFRVFGEALQELPTRREMHEALDALRAELRGEMMEMRAELRGEMMEMRADLRGEIGELRTDMSFVKTAVLDLSKRFP